MPLKYNYYTGALDLAANAQNPPAPGSPEIDVLIKSDAVNLGLSSFIPEVYGALGNGSADDSAAIQLALSAAYAAGGGVVQLNPSKRYGISPGGVTIPTNVTLTFGTGASTARQVVNYGAGQAATSPTLGGGFALLGGSGGSDTATAYIEFSGPRSALIGASFYDPDQNSANASPVVKPFAVRTTVYGCTLDGIELINVYRGIDVRGGRTVVRNITGNPLSLGIRVDTAYDVPRLSECHFVDSFVHGTVLASWFAVNSKSYQFLDNDYLLGTRLFSYGYNVGLELAASPVSGRTGIFQGTYGVLSDSDFDGCTTAAILDSCTQGVGMQLSNVGFTPLSASGSASGYHSTSTKIGVTSLDHCNFWGQTPVSVRIDGGEVRLHNCLFWENQVSAYDIYVTGSPTICLQDNDFRNGAPSGNIYILTSTAIGYMLGNKIAGTTGNPVAVNNSLGVLTSVPIDATRSINANYPKFIWQATGNGANLNKVQAYLDPSGNLVVTTLNDAENSALSLATFKRDGTCVIVPPSADPHVAGAIWWNGTAFVRSNG